MTTLDINSQKISGDCTLKCAYSFDYQNSSTVATNDGFSIKLTYDKANIPPVLYNANKYEVGSIMIFSPSIHLFNGRQSNAEVVIEHRPVIAGPPFSVGIPVMASSSTSSTPSILSQIINAVSYNAPSNGESTNINISGFNLNSLVPSKIPFYSYTRPDSTNWIVFGKENSILLDKSTLDTLSKIIKPLPAKSLAAAGPSVFYNDTGAVKGLSGSKDQIYIDCQPVNESEEKEDVVKLKSPISFDLDNSTTTIIIQVILSCILFVVFIFGIYYGLKYLSNTNASSQPKVGKPS